MIWWIPILLLALAGLLIIVEWRGARTTITLSFRGDLHREAAFLAQYGQSVCTPIAAWLVAIAKGSWTPFLTVMVPVMAVSVLCLVLKRSTGRIRPGRERAGRFTGFGWRRDSKRESFPSSHSASAFALSVALAHHWPEAAVVWWLLAGSVGLLRYLMEAHFPSDVLAGCAVGYVVGWLALEGTLRVLAGMM